MKFLVILACGVTAACATPYGYGGMSSYSLSERGLGIEHQASYRLAGTYDRSGTVTDRLNCSDFPSSETAQRAFVAGGGPARDPNGLDADGDGFACEFDPSTYVARRAASTFQPTSGSNCHWVSGYTRRDGTRVRGHQRCR